MHVATLRKPLSTLLPTKAESRDAISAASLLLRLHGNTTPASLLFKSRRLSGVGLLTKRIAARSRFSAVLVSAATRFRAVKIDSSLHISLKKHEVVLCSTLVRVVSYDKAPHYISLDGTVRTSRRVVCDRGSSSITSSRLTYRGSELGKVACIIA